MDALTPVSSGGESHIKPESPTISPRLTQNSPDINTPAPFSASNQVTWRVENGLMYQAKPEDLETSSSTAPAVHHPTPEAPPTPERDTSTCEPMYPFDNFSTNCSTMNAGWKSSPESGESEHWTLQNHELLPNPPLYAHSPTTPTSGWDCAGSYQFQSAPTSAGYYPDCSVPFSASTPPPMQANYSPVFETETSYGSPQYPNSCFGDGSPAHQHMFNMGMSGMNSMAHGVPSHHEYPGMIATPTSESSPAAEIMPLDGDINSLPYSQLLYKAFMSAPGQKLSLREIYDWFKSNTNKPANNRGWQNSIRHNLSMNGAFQKASPKESGRESKRATEWVLAKWAIGNGVTSTTRFRKTSNRPKSGGPDRERMAHSPYTNHRVPMGYNSRSRERAFKHRIQMHSMPSNAEFLYGSSLPPPHLVGALPEVEGYMPPPPPGFYCPQIQAPEAYREFNPQDVMSPEGYPVYNVGEGAMMDGAMAGGVANGAMSGAYASGVGPPASALPFAPQLSSGPMPNDQHLRNYSPIDYDATQGMGMKSDVVHE